MSEDRPSASVPHDHVQGRRPDNGVPEHLRLRSDRLSDEARAVLCALPCEYVPVAIKFCAVSPEHAGLRYPKMSERMSLCQFVSHAQQTKTAFYIDKTNENCMGRTVLGMADEPPLGASGQAGYDFGVFRDQNANSRLYYQIPKAIRNTINYVVFAPVDQCEFNPDLMIFVGNTKAADIILRATSYISGDLWESKSSSVLSCAWTYMYPWLSGKVNFTQTGLHHGMSRRKVYPEGLTVISVPYQKLDELVLALREMDWELIAFRDTEEDRQELTRRMRRWNEFAREISEGGEFSLPENSNR